MSPENTRLAIDRVSNGWILYGTPHAAGYAAESCVASTPQQLADLIIAWAQQQQDATKS